MTHYVPKPGTAPARVIEYLKANGPTRISALCPALGLNRGSIGPLLRKAMDAGLIERTGHTSSIVYSIPEPAADEEPPPFNLALWLDGDLTICGFTANDNGTVVVTRDQVEQLRRLLGAA